MLDLDGTLLHTAPEIAGAANQMLQAMQRPTLDAMQIQGYIGEGDLFVFASVLNEFFALYASLNSYHELRVKSTQGEVYKWAPRMGLQPLL